MIKINDGFDESINEKIWFLLKYHVSWPQKRFPIKSNIDSYCAIISPSVSTLSDFQSHFDSYMWLFMRTFKILYNLTKSMNFKFVWIYYINWWSLVKDIISNINNYKPFGQELLYICALRSILMCHTEHHHLQ